MAETSGERLEVPSYNEQDLERGARLAAWLGNIRRLPEGVELINENDVDFSFVSLDESDQQCAVIVPSEPIETHRRTYDYSGERSRIHSQALDPISNPFVVVKFEFQDFTDDLLPGNELSMKAASPLWAPNPDDRKLKFEEEYAFDPTKHQIAVVNNWFDPRV